MKERDYTAFQGVVGRRLRHLDTYWYDVCFENYRSHIKAIGRGVSFTNDAQLLTDLYRSNKKKKSDSTSIFRTVSNISLHFNDLT